MSTGFDRIAADPPTGGGTDDAADDDGCCPDCDQPLVACDCRPGCIAGMCGNAGCVNGPRTETCTATVTVPRSCGEPAVEGQMCADHLPLGHPLRASAVAAPTVEQVAKMFGEARGRVRDLAAQEREGERDHGKVMGLALRKGPTAEATPSEVLTRLAETSAKLEDPKGMPLIGRTPRFVDWRVRALAAEARTEAAALRQRSEPKLTATQIAELVLDVILKLNEPPLGQPGTVTLAQATERANNVAQMLGGVAQIDMFTNMLHGAGMYYTTMTFKSGCTTISLAAPNVRFIFNLEGTLIGMETP